MQNINFLDSELPTTDTATLARLARRAGYANAAAGALMIPGQPTQYIIWVEDTVTDSKAQILQAITSVTDQVIILTPTTVNLPSDGVTTANVQVSGAPNSQINVLYQGSIPISNNFLTLDNAGNASLTIGPFPSNFLTAQPLIVLLQAADLLTGSANLLISVT